MISSRMTAMAAATAAVLILALGTLAAPASAATRHSTSGTHARFFKVTGPGGVTTPAAASAFTACPVSAFGYGGEAICDTFGFSDYNPDSGTDEAFVIGLDWSIWHAWPGSNGWHSLGGQALHETGNGVGEFSSNPFTVDTLGTNGLRYCRVWPWTRDWGRC